MKLIGFLFVCCVVIGVVGYLRGWFTVTTVSAGGKDGMTVTIESDKLSDDAYVLQKQLPLQHDANAVTTTELATEVAGVLSAIDVAARNLSLTVGGETIVQHVKADVAIDHDGESLGLEDLRATMRVQLIFASRNQQRSLVRVVIL